MILSCGRLRDCVLSSCQTRVLGEDEESNRITSPVTLAERRPVYSLKSHACTRKSLSASFFFRCCWSLITCRSFLLSSFFEEGIIILIISAPAFHWCYSHLCKLTGLKNPALSSMIKLLQTCSVWMHLRLILEEWSSCKHCFFFFVLVSFWLSCSGSSLVCDWTLLFLWLSRYQKLPLLILKKSLKVE